MKTNTAKQNIAILPEYCYAILLSTRKLIKIVAGKSGYFKLEGYPANRLDNEHTDTLADKLNDNIGVTKGQREAMEVGSMWGWSVPGANPDNYNDDGSPNFKTT